MLDPRIEEPPDVPGGWDGGPPPETTGRQIVVFADDADTDVDWHRAGLRTVADSREFSTGGIPSETLRDAEVTMFAQLGMAVVTGEPVQVAQLQTDGAGRRVLSVSAELVHHVRQDVGEYLRGYRDGVADLTERVLDPGGNGGRLGRTGAPPTTFADTAQATWGIQATGVDASPWSGAGIGVAVLDTGFDLAHPDFSGRHGDRVRAERRSRHPSERRGRLLGRSAAHLPAPGTGLRDPVALPDCSGRWRMRGPGRRSAR